MSDRLAVCRHCGQAIEQTDRGQRWRHTSTNTSTGTKHMTCGPDGSAGTYAEPR